MEEYKVEERKMSFLTYLAKENWKTLKDHVSNLMNHHNLGKDFDIEEGKLIVRFISNRNMAKKIK